MSELIQHVRKTRTLKRAWSKIRENGLSSSNKQTVQEIRAFNENADSNLKSIQGKLSQDSFNFGTQTGILIKKKGKDKRRPLVIAPIQNRIVQRAILDTLQEKVSLIQNILDTPTSIGGIPERGTPQALSLINKARDDGLTHYVRSDIPDFFCNIPRNDVIDKITNTIEDKKFKILLQDSVETFLNNELEISEHKDIFPIGPIGVAQGSPLSPLIGNILLKDFDDSFNCRGIVCIRYIDDFLLLGKSSRNVKEAFTSAQEMLENFGLSAYHPDTCPDKASKGVLKEGLDFLGYRITDHTIRPSRENIESILQKINQLTNSSKQQLRKAANNQEINQTYAKSLKILSDTVNGWGYSFKYCNPRDSFHRIDLSVDNCIANLQSEFTKLTKGKSQRHLRKVLGIKLLSDIPITNLPSA